jgi:hypothetical protein
MSSLVKQKETELHAAQQRILAHKTEQDRLKQQLQVKQTELQQAMLERYVSADMMSEA